MQKRIWFLKINDKKEGPYSLQQLKNDSRVTPDTLVWREGFKEWVKARHIPELKSIFEDEVQDIDFSERFKAKTVPQDDSILALERSNFPFFYWFIIILILALLYVLYELHLI